MEELPRFEADQKWRERRDELLEEWGNRYPELDLDLELMRKAHAWLVESGKRYTAMIRYLGNWMRSAATSQRRRPQGQGKPKRQLGGFSAEDWG